MRAAHGAAFRTSADKRRQGLLSFCDGLPPCPPVGFLPFLPCPRPPRGGGDARSQRDMNQYQFQAAKPPTEAEQRPTTDVFKSAAGQSEGFKSRFASTGNFTSAQLEEGADGDATAVPEEAEPGMRSVLAARIACMRPTRGGHVCVVQRLMTTGPSTHDSRSKRTPSKKSGSKSTPLKTRRGPDFSPAPC